MMLLPLSAVDTFSLAIFSTVLFMLVSTSMKRMPKSCTRSTTMFAASIIACWFFSWRTCVHIISSTRRFMYMVCGPRIMTPSS